MRPKHLAGSLDGDVRPAVSVILPFRNAEDTIEGAVESIRCQTFQDWELVAFDDGSGDASRGYIERCAAADARIRVEQSAGRAHVGITEALRRACSAARGEYLVRMDADDTAHPQRIERQVEWLRRDPRLGLCGTLTLTTGEKVGSGRQRYEIWLNALIHHDDIVRERFVECPVAHPTFAMSRTAYEDAGGYQERGWAEDYDLVLRMIQRGWRVEKVPETLLEWRARPKRLSMTDPRYSEAAFRKLKRHYLQQDILAQRPCFHQWGAGEVGKQWLREWGASGPAAVVDLNPRKIGRIIHGIPVIAPEALPPPGRTYILVAVGKPGAREDIRDRLHPRGYREMEDFLFVA